MTPLGCVIPGAPVPYARARHSGRHHWKPRKHAAWEVQAVGLLQRAQRGLSWPPEAPYGFLVVIRAYYPSGSAKRAERGQSKRTARSDLDNVAKLVLDACTKAGAVPDDRLVSQLWCERRWAEGPGRERVEVTVTPAQGGAA